MCYYIEISLWYSTPLLLQKVFSSLTLCVCTRVCVCVCAFVFMSLQPFPISIAQYHCVFGQKSESNIYMPQPIPDASLFHRFLNLAQALLP